MRRAAAALLAALFVWTTLPAGAAPAATSHALFVRFSDLGFVRDIVLGRGSPRTFSVFFPVFPQLQRVTLVLPMRISSIVDPSSSITVSVQGVPVYTNTVGKLGREPRIEVPLPIRRPVQGTGVTIAVAANVFTLRNNCRDDSDPNDWATIDPSGGWQIDAATGPPRDLAEWFESYDADVAVVVPSGTAPAVRNLAPALAYALQRVPRWRKLRLRLTDAAPPGARTAQLVEPTTADLALAGNVLRVTAEGLTAIRPLIARSFSGKTVADVTVATPSPTPAVRELTLAQLGMRDQTHSGTAPDLTFAVPFSLADIGGLPRNLTFILGFTATAVRTNRPSVNISVNGSLVRSYTLAAQGKLETFTVPIRTDLLGAANTLQVSTSEGQAPQQEACLVPPRVTATLSNASRFAWSGVDTYTGGVGDFLVSARGTLAILLANPAQDLGAAFDLATQLGAINDRLATLTVGPFDGSLPRDANAIAVIGAPDRVAVLNPEFDPDGDAFQLVDRNGRLLYRANYDQPFGVLQTLPNVQPPTLIETYWKDRSALTSVTALAPSTLAAQADTLVVFSRNELSYGPIDRRQARLRAPPNPFAWIMLTGFLLIVLGVIGAIVIGTRRRRTPSAN